VRRGVFVLLWRLGLPKLLQQAVSKQLQEECGAEAMVGEDVLNRSCFVPHASVLFFELD
jgi:hypothetical protein